MTDKNPLHIVVTGASRGLGHAMVEQFVAAGHTVSACARSGSVMKALGAKWPAPHSFTAVDLADHQATDAWCKSVLKHSGAPDILINNAAVINENAPLWEVPYADFHYLININITAVFNVIQQLLPSMMETNEGLVVNFSSEWGRSVSPDVASYCASKWAIEGMTTALAADLRNYGKQEPGNHANKGLAAIALSPGVVNTDMLQSCFGDAANHYAGANEWAVKAVPYILSLTHKDNGKSLTTPA